MRALLAVSFAFMVPLAAIPVALGLANSDLELDQLGLLMTASLVAAIGVGLLLPTPTVARSGSRLTAAALTTALVALVTAVLPLLFAPEDPPSWSVFAYATVEWASPPLAAGLGIAGFRRSTGTRARAVSAVVGTLGVVTSLLWIIFLYSVESS